MRVRGNSILLLVTAALFLVPTDAVARQIVVAPKDGMAEPHHLDVQSSSYGDRVSDVLASIGVIDSTIGRFDVLGHDQLPEWSELPESLGLRMYRSVFRWEFSVAAFEQQIAFLKSLARRSLWSTSVKSSLRSAESMRPVEASEWSRKIRYVDSLSYGRYRFPEVQSRRVRKHVLNRISNSYGAAKQSFTNGVLRERHQRLHIRYCGTSSDSICAGEPVVVWPLNTFRTDAAVHARIVVPMWKSEHVVGVAQVGAYTGAKDGYTDRDFDLNIGKWPHVTLSEAFSRVSAQTRETPVAAVYTDAFGMTVLLVAVLTASDNVYLVEPLVGTVW